MRYLSLYLVLIKQQCRYIYIRMHSSGSCLKHTIIKIIPVPQNVEFECKKMRSNVEGTARKNDYTRGICWIEVVRNAKTAGKLVIITDSYSDFASNIKLTTHHLISNSLYVLLLHSWQICCCEVCMGSNDTSVINCRISQFVTHSSKTTISDCMIDLRCAWTWTIWYDIPRYSSSRLDTNTLVMSYNSTLLIADLRCSRTSIIRQEYLGCTSFVYTSNSFAILCISTLKLITNYCIFIPKLTWIWTTLSNTMRY